MRFLLFGTLLLLGLSSCVVSGQSNNSPVIISEGNYGMIKSSDDFPTPYGPNINKTWEIRVREGYRVHLHFTTFDLEDSYDDDQGGVCAYDYVQIEGHGKFCGNHHVFPQDAPTPNREFKSTGNVMRITFVSDYSNEKPFPLGFAAHWTEEDVDECFELRRQIKAGVEDWDQILYCNHFCNNVPGSYYCSCRPGFTLNTNRHTCVANCDTSETAADPQGGSIESTDYPKYYGKLSNCVTTLRAKRGMRMDVRFDDVFGIEEHYEEGCVYDYLELIDHRDSSQKYCGNVAPDNGSWIVLNSNPIRIHFFSDLVTEGKGYKLYYRTYPVSCGGGLDAPGNGSIVSIPEKEFLVYEDEIQFACDRGFRLVGSNVSVCTETGEWSSQTPTCEIKHCPRPDALLRISRTNPPAFEEDERPFNSSLTIPCISQWYELVSGASEWFCDADETWKVRGRVVSRNDNNNYPECRPICGRKNSIVNPLFEDQILGGRNARYGEWPWMAFVDIGLSGINADGFCGGSLVDEKYVVTAAHCIQVRASEIRVYLGVTNRFDLNSSHVQVFSVVSATNHPNYATRENINNLFDNDIAVLKLNATATIGRYVRPICIPRSPQERNLPENSEARGVVAGWGLTALGQTARVLQVVRVPYVNATYCRLVFRNQSRDHPGFGHVMVTDNHFCAGFLNKAKDSCDGDSGGPLMWRNQRRWFLNGIVSFGTTLQGCQIFVIGVYTKVANYLNFLDNHIILDP